MRTLDSIEICEVSGGDLEGSLEAAGTIAGGLVLVSEGAALTGIAVFGVVTLGLGAAILGVGWLFYEMAC